MKPVSIPIHSIAISLIKTSSCRGIYGAFKASELYNLARIVMLAKCSCDKEMSLLKPQDVKYLLSFHRSVLQKPNEFMHAENPARRLNGARVH